MSETKKVKSASTVKSDDVDFDNAPKTVEEIQNLTRLYMEKYNTNSVNLSATVRELNVSESKAKIDKKTNLPILDENGATQFWEPFYSATISFEGGEMNINVKKDMHESLEVGKRYLFEGVKGLSFGRISDMFYKCTAL